MEAFARSSTTLFAKANINRPLFPIKSLLGRSDICFLRSLDSNVNVHHTFLLRHKALQLVAPSQTEVLTASETAGIGIQATEPSETAHVRFRLHKECKFGESFLLVGNEPIIGQWNPSSAIPLNWSDGNIWTVELDVPIGRPIQYKFILKENTGEMLWQPGPDRILHTWSTKNTIAISEDWKDFELQKISEVQIKDQNEALLVNFGIGPIVPGIVTHPGELMLNVNRGANFSGKIASADDKTIFSSKNDVIFEEKVIQSADVNLGIGSTVPGDVTRPGQGFLLNVNKGANFSGKVASAYDKPTFSSKNEVNFEENTIQSEDLNGVGPNVPGNTTHLGEELMLNEGANFSWKLSSAYDNPSFTSKNEVIFEEKTIQSADLNPRTGPTVPGNVSHPGETTLNVNKIANFSGKIASADEKPTSSSKNEVIFEEKAIKSADGTSRGIRKEVRIADDGNCFMKVEAIKKTTPTTLPSNIPESVKDEDEDEDEETLSTYQGGPVLMPSITPIQRAPSEEELPKEIGKSIATDGANRVASTEKHNSC